ncbi:MAG: T9SS type A sorting domain-containing protein [Bacteroidetes bacterium]|nr:T9SS type A sorting domain-containing protein [Bacteroidota bacterium]
MKKSFFILVIICLSAKSFLAQPCKEIIGYYPNWQWYDRNKLVQPSTIAYHKYSVINYCFFKPESTGAISNTDSWADENLLQGQINWSTSPYSYYPNTSLVDLAHNAGTKVMVSIGGWTLSDNFPTIAASAGTRTMFASECCRLIRFYHFDGIDIDWEYPGFSGHSGTSADKHNFTLMLQQVRDSLNVLGQAHNKNYLLSACFSAASSNAANIEWNNVSGILDMINLMTYDFFGAWDCTANHNTPLYTTNVGDPAFNINSAWNMLTLTYGVAPSKINVGVAFYGRSQTGATALYQPTNCGVDNITFQADAGSPLYYNIMASMGLFTAYWDNTAQVPYLLGNTGGAAAGTFVSYDNKQSIGLKAQYIKNKGARGAIIWEITGDYMETSPGSGVIAGTPLADTLNTVFCSSSVVTGIVTAETETPALYPNPASDAVFVNLREHAVLSVFSVHGELVESQVLQEGLHRIDISGLTEGIYFMHVQTKNKLYVTKCLKQSDH